MVEIEVDDSNEVRTYQASLAFRGTKEQPTLYLDENMFNNWKCLGSLTPLPRGKLMPKLAKMGIPMTILRELLYTQLAEILCLVCIILYDAKVQGTVSLDHTGAEH